MGENLVYAGATICLVALILIVIKAFRTSLLWGLLSLLVPIAGLVYVFTHWEESKKPFLLFVVGMGVGALGGWMIPPPPA